MRRNAGTAELFQTANCQRIEGTGLKNTLFATPYLDS
jgi:hypothetical protein